MKKKRFAGTSNKCRKANRTLRQFNRLRDRQTADQIHPRKCTPILFCSVYFLTGIKTKRERIAAQGFRLSFDSDELH